MPKPRPSVLKRQREQKKRDRQAEKAAQRAERKQNAQSGVTSEADEFEIQTPEEQTN